MKAKREREPDNPREKAVHRFVDVGPPLEDRYRPVVSSNPEQTLAELAEIFLRLGRDYAGALPADHAYRSLMQTAAVLHAAAMGKMAKKAAVSQNGLTKAESRVAVDASI